MTYTTTAIILNRYPFREADLRVVLFSRDFGKIEAAAIGAKKIKSKLAGQLEPLREVKVMLAKGKGIDKIGQAITLNNFGVQTIREPALVWQAQEAAEAVSRLVAAGQKEEAVYELLKKFLIFTFQGAARPHFSLVFRFQLMGLAGWQPELKICLGCRRPIGFGQNYFSFVRGGLVCPACLDKEGKTLAAAISPSAIKALRYWQSQPLEKALGLLLPPVLSKETKEIIDTMATFHS